MPPHAMLALDEVRAMVPYARRLRVAKSAWGPGGFVRAYMAAGSYDKLPAQWLRRRVITVRRHLAQAQRQGETWWQFGSPTRRHLALIMWAYSPTPPRLRLFLEQLQAPMPEPEPVPDRPAAAKRRHDGSHKTARPRRAG